MISALAREGHRKRAYVDRSLTAVSYNVILKPYGRYGYALNSGCCFEVRWRY